VTLLRRIRPKGGLIMPWKETDVMNLRTEFVLRVFEGKLAFGELCREYGISRKTGYKWKERFLERGIDGLADQSRRPRSSPRQVDEDTACRIVRLKLAHPGWGPRKIRKVVGALVPAGRSRSGLSVGVPAPPRRFAGDDSTTRRAGRRLDGVSRLGRRPADGRSPPLWPLVL